MSMSFSIRQLEDPNNSAAALVRNPRTYNKLLYDVFPVDPNRPVMDRRNVALPHAQHWAKGNGDFYVGTDTCRVTFEETDLPAGQYYKRVVPPPLPPTDRCLACGSKGDKLLTCGGCHKAKFCNATCQKKAWTTPVGPSKTKHKLLCKALSHRHHDEWEWYVDPTKAPGNVGGFHKAVIDTKQPGSHWILSARAVENQTCFGADIGTSAVFCALSRVDYAGFKSRPNDHFIMDQCYNHLKVCEFPSLKTGKIVIRDCGGGGRINEPRTIDGPMDGYFPISLHHDEKGLMDLIMIRFHIKLVGAQDIFEGLAASFGAR